MGRVGKQVGEQSLRDLWDTNQMYQDLQKEFPEGKKREKQKKNLKKKNDNAPNLKKIFIYTSKKVNKC